MIGIFYALLGINVFLIVWAFIERRETPHKYLLVLYLSNLISVLDDVYDVSEWWRIAPHLYNIYIPSCFIIAPAIYLYVRSLVAPQRNLRFQFASKHWLGFILSLLLCLPYFLFEPTQKLQRLLAPVGSLDHLGLVTFGPFVCLLMVIPFSMVYLVASLREISRNHIRIKAFFSDIEDKTLSWARWAIVIFGLVLLFSALQLFMPDSVTETPAWRSVYAVFGYSWLLAFGLMALKQKPIEIDERSNLDERESKHDCANLHAEVQDKSAQKYKNAPLCEEEIKEITGKLLKSMQVEQLYKTAGLTLRELTDELAISQNKASQVLNNHMGVGFYDFVNSWRVDHAKSKIVHDSWSLLEVAFDAGFNSKSTFNAAFKKHSGLTPSQYKKANQQR